jgi:hypothetical protein
VSAGADLLHWLDAVPARNTTLGYTLLTATLGLAAWPLFRGDRRRGWESGWLFAGAVLLTLCAFRWPIWFVNYELNPDESQMIAGARTLQDFPVYWKYVDGTTHGPLGEYFLVLLGACGLPMNFVTARLGATLLQGATLLALWGTFRRIGNEGAARLALAPVFVFWSLVYWPEYVHYSTELVPVALVAGAVWLLVEALVARPFTDRLSPVCAALGGAALGAVPFGKLQVGPLAFLVGCVALAALGWRRREPGAARVAAWTVAGALLPSAGLAVFLTIFGLWGQFELAYIQSNLGYMGDKPTGLVDMMSDFFALITHGQTYAWFIVPTVAYALWHSQERLREAPLRDRTLVGAGWLAIAVAFYSVIAPGRMFGHYLHTLTLPAAFLVGLLFARGLDRPATSRTPWLAIVAFLAVTAAPQIFRQATGYNVYAGNFANHRVAPPLPASAYLLAHARPGDRLAMWGWQSQVWVETGLAQGTRDAHTAYQLNPTPLRDFYRSRYLSDMQRRQPEWFVDTVGPADFGYRSRTVDGHETFPPLTEWVRTRYDLVAEVGDVRIYRLKSAP